ncbi:hypothetical protein MSAN_00205600 [Mycena sanguinolenta]|uniref:Uncharacterized protein n=1 Tax=Mycena sanguinolenta TaxID=230812 RepID=A0A8H6ZJ13_9AGAR|nr:hypothetical protein MSAN_00205600 [Mycena sanguinolenta]
MAFSQHDRDVPATTARRFSRKLGLNELSYYLPSRAYGLNDMFTRVIFRSPPALVSPYRLQIVWAIIRVRNSLLASKIDMAPGCYDDARFIYTPPASPMHALEEASHSLTIHDYKTGPELDDDFITGRRKLSAQCLSRMDVARHREVPSGNDEFHLALTVFHAITDGSSGNGNRILMLLGGSNTPGGPPRTDGELLKILELEWSWRWGQPRLALSPLAFEVITPSAEARLPRPRTKFQAAALKIDFMNLQRQAIGGHTFPRIPSQVTNQTLVEVKFDRAQTTALLSKCEAEGVTLQNTVFALCNFAWIRTAANHPEISAPKTLPMLFYTAISLRRHLAAIAPLTSAMVLALGYGNIVLPAFIPSSADPSAMFWLRARSVQLQMRKQTQSPLLLGRAQILSAERARRAKVFARQDDEANGTLPPNPPRTQGQPPLAPATVPSVALMGISHLGDLTASYQPEDYPPIEFLDSVGHSRKAKGGILLFTRSAQGCFSMMLEWDSTAFPAGLVEEFWSYCIGGVDEFILGQPRLQSRL